jgi:hypothetical protein
MSTPAIATVADVVPIVEIGIGQTYGDVQAGRWDIAKWDDAAAHWSGTEPSWVDVTCDVRAVDSTVGHDRTLDAWDVGTCTITLDNASGWADLVLNPLTPGQLDMRPGRSIRWGVRDLVTNMVTWRFRGFIDAMRSTYVGPSALSDTAVLECVDALGEVARTHLTKVDPLVGDGEGANARLHRILDAAGWRAEWRDIAASNVPLVGTDLVGDYLGRVAFRGRDWQTWVPGTPPDLVLGNIAPATVCPSSIEVAFPRAGTTTRSLVNFDGADTPPYQVDDTAAQANYGIETTPERLDLQTSDPTQLTSLARRLVTTRGVATMPRVNALTLDAGRDRATMLAVLGADPQRPTRWRLVVNRAGRSLLDRMLFATEVTHSWDAGGWRASVRLDDAMPWSAAGGRWDTAAWDGASWSSGAARFEDLLARLEASA